MTMPTACRFIADRGLLIRNALRNLRSAGRPSAVLVALSQRHLKLHRVLAACTSSPSSSALYGNRPCHRTSRAAWDRHAKRCMGSLTCRCGIAARNRQIAVHRRGWPAPMRHVNLFLHPCTQLCAGVLDHLGDVLSAVGVIASPWPPSFWSTSGLNWNELHHARSPAVAPSISRSLAPFQISYYRPVTAQLSND